MASQQKDLSLPLIEEPRAPRGQRFVEPSTEAPFILRPPLDDPDDSRHWVFKAIEKTGQTAQEALVVWVEGYRLEDRLMWDVLGEFFSDHAEAMYRETWSHLEPDFLDHVRSFISSDRTPFPIEFPDPLDPENHPHGIFPALSARGISVEDALVLWLKGFVMHDHWMWRTMEDRGGAREAVIAYSRVWENIALGFLDQVKGHLGLTEVRTMDDIGRLSQAYWEAIGSVYRVAEHNSTRHVGEILTCPFWDTMIDLYGKQKANEMQKKVIGPTSANYYQALMKEVGRWGEIFMTQDKFRCLGDDLCRVVYEKR